LGITEKAFVMSDAIPNLRITVDPKTMKSWAKLLHDPNPIHLDSDLVRGLGYPDVIVQGPANLAFIINALKAAFPDGRIEKLAVRYLDNAFGGETLDAGGKVTNRIGIGEDEHIACEVWLTAAGRPIIGGTATVVARVPTT
jgi:hydroxyacyl-ACP dehydratase HTD2-like protein with hotdog domain